MGKGLIVAIIAVRAAPWARRIAPPTMPTSIIGRLGITICKNPMARSCVSPVAPRSAVRGTSDSQTASAKSEPKATP